eukprot:13388978-Alexandrium_andersonii.AAC.1
MNINRCEAKLLGRMWPLQQVQLCALQHHLRQLFSREPLGGLGNGLGRIRPGMRGAIGAQLGG